ncbi:hypothetical protein VTK26DRAFT_4103 [Humicola hyalothermophila]
MTMGLLGVGTSEPVPVGTSTTSVLPSLPGWVTTSPPSLPSSVGAGAGAGAGDDLFGLLARLFARAKRWAEGKLRRANVNTNPNGGVVAPRPGRHEHEHQHEEAPGSAGGGAVEAGARVGSGSGSGTASAMMAGAAAGVPDVEDFSWMELMDLGSDQWFEDVLGWLPVHVSTDHEQSGA